MQIRYKLTNSCVLVHANKYFPNQ